MTRAGWHQDKAGEIDTSISHFEDGISDTRDEDDEGLRPANRQRKLSSEPVHPNAAPCSLAA